MDNTTAAPAIEYGKSLAWPKEKGLLPLTETPHPDVVASFREFLQGILAKHPDPDDVFARPTHFETALLPAYVEAIMEEIDARTPVARPAHKWHLAAIAANFVCAHLTPFENEPDPTGRTTVSPRGLTVLNALGKKYKRARSR